jgi:hypothetical protein
VTQNFGKKGTIMVLPVVSVKKPSNIEGLNASQISTEHNTKVFFPGAGYSALNKQAARSWNCMALKIKQETGVTLTAISTADVLRSYNVQVQGFNRDYTLGWSLTINGLTNRTKNIRKWNGTPGNLGPGIMKTYYLKKGAIPKAIPGGGNHPLGLAVDVAIYDVLLDDGNAWPGGSRNIHTKPIAWEWLKDNAVRRFGWSWEIATEGVDDPHLHYFAGDDIPKEVLEIEAFFNALNKPK